MRVILFTALFISSSALAQPCTGEDDLDTIPGKFVDHNWTPTGGNSYCEGQARTAAIKTMTAIEAICKKNFWGDGAVGKGSFGFIGGRYYEEQFMGSYAYNIGFYQLRCENGKLVTAHEYGTDLDIVVNPSSTAGEPISSAMETGDNAFNIPGTRKDYRNEIALFRYLIFKNKEEVMKINNGSGYFEGQREIHDAYDKHPDIRRYWFITPPGKQLLIPATRKEFLNSLLEFYERELPPLVQRCGKLIKSYREDMAKYSNATDAKGKKQYEYFRRSAEESTADSLKFHQNHAIKKQKVNEILKANNEEWLSQPAVITKAQADQGYCRCETLDDFKASGCYTFNNFAEGDDGFTIYKWNPAVFKGRNSCDPAFIRVSLRYKFDVKFSEKIRDHYTEKLDFSALRKLLVTN